MLDKYKFIVQEKKTIRVIIDTDAACEADDQYAICHALMTPRFDVRGIVAEQFNSEGGEKSVEKSLLEINKILSLMEINDVPSFCGSDTLLSSDSDAPFSQGSDFIISEALRESSLPLFVLCQGSITNVAAAINKCPEIAKKMTVIWIGGGFYPAGGWEFNLLNDFNAANAVFKSGVELWQVPIVTLVCRSAMLNYS